MKRLFLPLVGLVAVAALAFAPTAVASSPHFVKGPDYTATTSALTATGKAAGLANAPTAVFLTVDEIDVAFHCVNKGNNFAPGHPATSTNVTGPTEDIAPHNGQITFTLPSGARFRAPRRSARTGTGRWSSIASITSASFSTSSRTATTS